MKDFIDSAALFSDVFAAMGMKVVLSGTDSLGFWLAMDQELYDRAKPIHTTFIPYRNTAGCLGSTASTSISAMAGPCGPVKRPSMTQMQCPGRILPG